MRTRQSYSIDIRDKYVSSDPTTKVNNAAMPASRQGILEFSQSNSLEDEFRYKSDYFLVWIKQKIV
jgi:hypothetical protein